MSTQRREVIKIDAQEALLAAADYIEQNGWWRRSFGIKNQRCMVGALREVNGVHGVNTHTPCDTIVGYRELRDYVQKHFPSFWSPESVNDSVLKTRYEAIDMLKSAAKELANEGR